QIAGVAHHDVADEVGVGEDHGPQAGLLGGLVAGLVARLVAGFVALFVDALLDGGRDIDGAALFALGIEAAVGFRIDPGLVHRAQGEGDLERRRGVIALAYLAGAGEQDPETRRVLGDVLDRRVRRRIVGGDVVRALALAFDAPQVTQDIA